MQHNEVVSIQTCWITTLFINQILHYVQLTVLSNNVKRGSAILAWNVWTGVLISDEEFEQVQMAIQGCPMDGSVAKGISRCWIAMFFHHKEFHNV